MKDRAADEDPLMAVCTGEPRNVDLPLSSACRSGICDGCTGFTDGYATYHCGHRCHWCPSGLHLRKFCPSAAEGVASG